jgi:hypothetical protein
VRTFSLLVVEAVEKILLAELAELAAAELARLVATVQAHLALELAAAALMVQVHWVEMEQLESLLLHMRNL